MNLQFEIEVGAHMSAAVEKAKPPRAKANEAAGIRRVEMLAKFIAERCHFISGKAVPFGEFYMKLIEWLPPEQRHDWTRIRLSLALPTLHQSIKLRGGGTFVGNLQFQP